MSLIYNITDPSLVYLTDLPHRMRPFQEVGAPHRRHWLENYSYYNESEDVASLYNSSISPASVYDPLGGHTVWQVILIGFFTGVLSLVTIIGNILVLLSFKVNKQLKTVNNYYLLSLAIADLIIGIVSMNLYTTYIIMDQWAMGNWACDLWLTIDYVASNASVMNLLVISFDRYFSITRPLTYRAKRTTKRAVTMIVLAWSISFVLWAPAILFWQFFVGERTVQPGKCYIQFLTEPIITFCTAIAAFYLPVTIMSVLYWRIYKETENRSRELEGLQGSGNQGEAARVAHPSRGSYKLNLPLNRRLMGRLRLWPPLLMGRKPKGHGEPEHSSSDSWNNNDAGTSMDPSDSEEEEIPETRAIYSIVLNLPGMKAAMNSRLACPSDLDASEEDPLRAKCSGSKQQIHSMHTIEVPKTAHSFGNKSPSAPISFKEAALAKRFAAKAKSQITKRKKLSLVKEKKAAQTLSAILFAFIITWTPYNIMVLMNTFCTDCIPETLWALGYWLCYVNSTVNPMCYALCNKTFRTTFRMILLCRWDSGRRNKQQPQVPQSHAVAFRRKIPGAS